MDNGNSPFLRKNIDAYPPPPPSFFFLNQLLCQKYNFCQTKRVICIREYLLMILMSVPSCFCRHFRFWTSMETKTLLHGKKYHINFSLAVFFLRTYILKGSCFMFFNRNDLTVIFVLVSHLCSCADVLHVFKICIILSSRSKRNNISDWYTLKLPPKFNRASRVELPIWVRAPGSYFLRVFS